MSDLKAQVSQVIKSLDIHSEHLINILNNQRCNNSHSLVQKKEVVSF